MISGTKLGKILETMEPSSEDEWDSLRQAVQMADSLQQSGHADGSLRVGTSREEPSFSPTRPKVVLDSKAVLSSLPGEYQAYFYAFLEALEVYHSIHGHPVTPESLRPQSLAELRKIRDMCLRRGLRAY